MSAFLRRSGQNPHRWATKGMKSKKELLAKKKHIKRKSAKAKHNRVLGIHNPHAAGADIGATEIYIAVPPDRLEMNVRCFGTFTPRTGNEPAEAGSLAGGGQEPWKLPLPEFIAECYRKSFGRSEPEHVRSLEEVVQAEEKRRKEKEARKAEKMVIPAGSSQLAVP